MDYQRSLAHVAGVMLMLHVAAPAIAEEIDDLVANYLQLPRSEQRLASDRLIRERLEPAMQLVLDEEELAEERLFAKKVVDRVALGQTLTEKGLRKTLKKIRVFEQMAVLELTRQFRVETKQAFEHDRRAYERRQAAWGEVLTLWTSAGEPLAGQALLIDWLQQALGRLRAGQTAKLPPRPRFEGLEMFAERTPAASPPAVAATKPTSPRADAAAKPASPSDVAAKPAINPQPEQARAAGRGAAPADAPRSASLPAEVVSPSPASVASAESRRTAPPPTSPPTNPAVKPAPTVPQSDWPTKPTPFSAKPSRSLSGRLERSGAGSATTRLTGAGVNLTELEARIVGFNSALADFHGRLAQHGNRTIDELTAIVEELTALVVRRSDLQLYWNLLGESEQRGLAGLRPVDKAIAAVGGRIDAARQPANSAADPVDDQDTRRHLLDELAERLSRLATGAGESGRFD